ncbi:MAG: WD40 repeat domain-containing protein [Verrucomicrobiales bacterium]
MHEALRRPPDALYRLRKYLRRHWKARRRRRRCFAALAAAAAVSNVSTSTVAPQRGARPNTAADFRCTGWRNRATASTVERRRLLARAVVGPGELYRLPPDGRGFATGFFAQPALPPVEHPAELMAAWSADGARLFTAAADGKIRVWDAATGEARGDLHAEDHAIVALAASPDGAHLAATCAGGATRIWALDPSGSPAGDPLRVAGERAIFAQGGAMLWAAAAGKARLYDAGSGAVAAEFSLPGGGSVEALAASADGRWLAAAAGKAVSVWDAERPGDAPATFAFGDRAVADVALSPDGGSVAAVFGSGRVAAVVFDRASGDQRAGPLWHAAPVRLAISPDGSRLATAAEDGGAQIWRLDNGEPLGAAIRHRAAIRFAAFSRSGTRLITAGDALSAGDGAAAVWDAWTGEPLSAPILHPEGASFAVLDPAGERLATGGRDKMLRVWDIRPRAATPLHLEHTFPPQQVAFSPDGGRALTWWSSYKVRAWDLASGAILVPNQSYGPEAVAFMAQSGPTWSPANAARRDEIPFARELIPGKALAAGASPDGRFLYVGGEDARLRAWCLADGSWRFDPVPHPAAITALCVEPGGGRVLAGCADGSVHLWDARTGKKAAGFPAAHAGRVLCAAFAGPGVALTGGEGGTARIWRIEGGWQSAPLTHGGAVAAVVADDTGRRVATGSADNSARVWDAATGSPITPPLAHIGGAPPSGLRLAFSPGGERLITAGSFDSTARIWDAATGEPLAPPLEHREPVAEIALTQDGAVLATATGSEIRLWDARTGDPITPPLRPGPGVTSIRFDAEARHLAAVCADLTVRVWHLPPLRPGQPAPDWLPDLAEAVAGARLTAAGKLEAPDAAMRRASLAMAGGSSSSSSGGGIGAWLAGDPAGRPISPAARSADRAAFVQSLAERGTVADLRGALRLSPMNPQIMARLGARLAEGDPPPAEALQEADFLTALAESLAPASPEIPPLRTEVLGALGRHGEALARNRDLLLAAPDVAAAWKARGRLLEREASIYGAYAAYAEAGRLAQIAGDAATANECSEALARIRPNPPDTFGDDYLRLQIMLAQRVALPGESERSAAARDTLERLRLAKADPAAALAMACDGLEAAPLDPGGWIELADLCEARGDLALAAGDRGAAANWFEAALAPLFGIVAPEARLSRTAEKLAAVRAPDRGNRRAGALAAGVDLDSASARLGLGPVAADTLRAAYAYRRRDFAACHGLIETLTARRPGDHRLAMTHAGCLYMIARDRPAEALKALGELDRAIKLAAAAGDRGAYFSYVGSRQWVRDEIARSDHPLLALFGGGDAFRRLAQEDLIEWKQIPPRDPAAPPELIDLTPFYTSSLDMDESTPTYSPVNSFANLPRGVGDLGGDTAFDVRGIVQFRSAMMADRTYHDSVAVELDRRCRALHLLQFTYFLDGIGREIARLTLRYADGTTAEQPVRIGIETGGATVEHAEARSATPYHPIPYATAPHVPRPDLLMAAYRLTWKNPHPEKVIGSLEIRALPGVAGLALVALTVE